MKKYLILSFLFLLFTTPVIAKNSPQNSGPKTNQSTTSSQPKPTITPTNNQTKNQNIDDSLTKVSDQVHQLISTVSAKGGIGQEVKEIAQNQIKNQENLKSSLAKLQLRKHFVKFFVGSDKKTVKNVEQQLEQNKLMIQKLEELKLKTKNPADLKQIQEIINLINNQNISIQDKINQENKTNGMFGWLINLFQKK